MKYKLLALLLLDSELPVSFHQVQGIYNGYGFHKNDVSWELAVPFYVKKRNKLNFAGSAL